MSVPHIPVMLEAVVRLLVPPGRSPARAIDGTLGASGHTAALLDAGVEFVLGLDLDPLALAIASERLRDYGQRAHLHHSSYEHMTEAAASLGWDAVDAILLDVGVSSMQIDTPARGFAFMDDGPLDMRFDPGGSRPPAAELVNYWDESELADIFYRYGEERHSRRIARAIVAARPIESTARLADVVAGAVPRPNKREARTARRIHPATRIFQALRIAVNDELGALERTLPQALDLLRPGGRLAVISFHSLEDRIVKRTFREASLEIVSPPGMVLEERQPVVRLVTRKPIVPDEDEQARNPRSRSARLRVVEKL